MREDQKTAILELEGLAVAIAAETFVDLVKGKRLVIFTDNQAVQMFLIKCRSTNHNLDPIIKKLCALEETLGLKHGSNGSPVSQIHLTCFQEKCLVHKTKSKVCLKKVWESCKEQGFWTSLITGERREVD